MVDVQGKIDETGAEEEAEGGLEVEEGPFEGAGDDNGDGGAKAFEDVVGVFDDGGDDEPSHGLQEDDADDGRIVAVEEAFFLHEGTVFAVDGDEGDDHGGDAHLDVADPHAGSWGWRGKGGGGGGGERGSGGVLFGGGGCPSTNTFQDAFEPDTSKAGRDTSHEDTKETKGRTLFIIVRARRGRGSFMCIELGKGDTDGEDDEGHPLGP